MIGFSGLSDHAAAGHTADLLDQSLGQALAPCGCGLEHHAAADPLTVEAFGQAVGLLVEMLRHCAGLGWRSEDCEYAIAPLGRRGFYCLGLEVSTAAAAR